MDRILARLSGPADLKRLSPAELSGLAEEIRAEIIDTVTDNGGHLAANLGVVELTIALHFVYDSPRDKLIWDTGHQSYAHKLLTGRQKRFPTLRHSGGLSGFCKRRESPHDPWGAGHAGTAISAALGFARARDLLGQAHDVVAIVGDGALTSGLSFEALNNAGSAGSRITVILNDNSMSIAPNVGAISAYLTRVRTDSVYTRLKEDMTRFVEQIPRVGPSIARTAERLKDSVKHLLVPGMLFEEMGFTYLGPVDGHNLPVLIAVLRDASRLKGPVLVHVLTQKGRGYGPAEERPDTFHGIGPSRPPERGRGAAGAKPPTYTEVFGRTLVDLAAARPEVVAITAAMTEGTGLQGFASAYPARFFDVGIAESHAVTFAGGLAAAGLRPVVAVYSTFLQRSYDQVVHDICLQRLPVVFALDRAGIVGPDGETHQGLFDLAYLRHIPDMSILVPRDENELRHALLTAIEHRGGPIALRYPRGAGRGVPLEEPRVLPWGRAEVLRRGGDAVLLAVGPLVYEALAAAERLARDGVEVTVVDARFVKPLDAATIETLARETGVIMTIEEHALQGGFGGAVLELLADLGLTGIRVRTLGLPDRFIEQGERGEILARHGLDADGIRRSVLAFLGETDAIVDSAGILTDDGEV